MTIARISESELILKLGLTGKWCCNSCHEDMDEFGFRGIDIELPNGDFAEVCCGVSREYEEHRKSERGQLRPNDHG